MMTTVVVACTSLQRGRGDLAHLGAHVVVESLDALRPGLDRRVSRYRSRQLLAIEFAIFFVSDSHHCYNLPSVRSQNSGRGGGIRTPKFGFGDRQFNR